MSVYIFMRLRHSSKWNDERIESNELNRLTLHAMSGLERQFRCAHETSGSVKITFSNVYMHVLQLLSGTFLLSTATRNIWKPCAHYRRWSNLNIRLIFKVLSKHSGRNHHEDGQNKYMINSKTKRFPGDTARARFARKQIQTVQKKWILHPELTTAHKFSV